MRTQWMRYSILPFLLIAPIVVYRNWSDLETVTAVLGIYALIALGFRQIISVAVLGGVVIGASTARTSSYVVFSITELAISMLLGGLTGLVVGSVADYFLRSASSSILSVRNSEPVANVPVSKSG